VGERSAVLVLDDGTIVRGRGFGATKRVSGEVVFNTGMVGYTESITDPSYKGQILMQTYPLIGNYGVYPEHFESDGPKIEGYIVRELCREPSHWSSRMSLDEWLVKSGVPGIDGVDTRALTKKIRVHGVMRGILLTYETGNEPSLDDLLEEAKHIPDPNARDLASEVATDKPQVFGKGGELSAVVIDCGVKMSIVRSLVKRGVEVTLMPPKSSLDDILSLRVNGVLVSNGPGDPKMCDSVIRAVRGLVEAHMPTFGICLGTQIIALALGGDTYKLKFGHRGQNHPCIDLSSGRSYITSQNHGFAVDEKSLDGTGLSVSFINANDKTVEGLTHKELPVWAVQFHPEASPGPNDTSYLFDNFVRLLRKS
jgi:carbamoyl-phosphate synthase small subunit